MSPELVHYLISPINRIPDGPAACACGYRSRLSDVRQHVGSNGMWPATEVEAIRKHHEGADHLAQPCKVTHTDGTVSRCDIQTLLQPEPVA